METNRILIFSLCLFLILSSCEEIDVPKDTPDCIKNEIEQISNEPVRNPPAEVWQYDYNGQTVFYLPSYCCDMFSELYDDKCNLICHPDGGIAGHGDGKCSDFFARKTNGKLIWKDDRGK